MRQEREQVAMVENLVVVWLVFGLVPVSYGLWVTLRLHKYR